MGASKIIDIILVEGPGSDVWVEGNIDVWKGGGSERAIPTSAKCYEVVCRLSTAIRFSLQYFKIKL